MSENWKISLSGWSLPPGMISSFLIIFPNILSVEGEDDEDTIDIKIPIKMNLKNAIEEVEKQILQNAAIKHKTTRQIAKALGVSQPTIVRQMNRYNIQSAQDEEPDS